MYEISDKESAIRAIQRFLLELHYYTDEIPHITIDGIYGDATRAAVSAYQRLAGLPENGTVDYITWERLYQDYEKAKTERTSKGRIPPDTPLPAKIGASGMGIASLQHLLNALAERYALAVRTDTSGVYSYATESVVNAIRRIYRMEEEGTVDRELYEKLLRDHRYPFFRN